jgi:hypothetical protein
MIEMQATDPVPCSIPVISLRPFATHIAAQRIGGGRTA